MPRCGVRPSGLVLGIVGGALLLSAGAFAQSAASSLTKEQLRTRILDLCVLTVAPKVGPKVAVAPTCNCYARGVSQAMSAEDAAYFVERRAIPSTLREQAAAVYAKCGGPA
jgi:hypothetical protein